MTSLNRSLSIVFDDTKKDGLTFGGPASWNNSKSAQWFNESAHTPDFALGNSGKFGSMTLEFIGTSAAFVGVTPPAFPDSQIFTVKIDDSIPYNTTYGDPNPPSYRQWFQTPILSDGKHTVSLTRIAGASFDYAVVAAGSSTPLLEQRAIVDNDDSSGILAYMGGWKRSSEQFNSGSGVDGFTYQNTTHQTSSVGDGMAFRFTGKAAAVYGVFTWSNIGVLSLNFTLDGSSMIRKFQVKADTPQFVSELGQQPHFQFQSYDFLDSGDHNLTVAVVECLNQTFIFDYMIYQPTFASIADIPSLVVQTGHPTSVPAPSKGISTSIIIGACVGTVFFIMLFVAAVYILRKQSQKAGSSLSKRGRYAPIEPTAHHDRNAVSPVSPTATITPFVISRPTIPFGQYQAESFELYPTHHPYDDTASSHLSMSTYRNMPHSSNHSNTLVYSGENQRYLDSDDVSNAQPPPSYEEVSSDDPRLLGARNHLVRRG